jgi:hypothetical protein
MPGQTFYSDNDSGTMADVLKAVGLAEVFGAWLDALGRDHTLIFIEDHGTHFQIHLPSSLDDSAISSIHQPFEVGRAKLLISKDDTKMKQWSTWGFEGFPYEEMQARRTDYFEHLKKLNTEQRAFFFKHPEAEEFTELRELTPHPDLRFYAYILNHLKGARSYNALLSQWYGPDIKAFRLNLGCVLMSFAQVPNDVLFASLRWDQAMKQHGASYQLMTTRWQLSNPASGKGGNAPKAKKLTIKNIKGFWLLEYLKLIGLFTVGVPMTVAGAKDRKTYVLRPMRVERSTLAEIMVALRQSLYASTAAKLDIMAVLLFTRLLVIYLQKAFSPLESARPTQAFSEAEPQVADVARRFEVAFYKDMGSALATMDVATLNLPSWVRSIMTAQEAQAVQVLLDEHIAAIRAIQTAQGEEGEEEREILHHYRDFLSGGTVRWFFDFAASYGDYVLRKRRRKEWGRPLTTDGLEKLMAFAQDKKTFSPILQREGFRAIAEAIRRSTILAQYYELREEGYPFEVRYSLGQELRTTASYPDDFLGALSDFLRTYNTENMRIIKRIKQGSLPDRPHYRRRFLRNEHLDQLIELVDEYGSDVVCKLLLAAGYMLHSARPAGQSTDSDDADPNPPEGDEDV